MRRLLFGGAGVLLAALFVVVQQASAGEPRIVGGHDADQPYPFAASLQTTDGQFFCGGTLVKADWLVTAAHCVKGQAPSSFTVRVGSNDRTQGGEVVTPDKVVPNPDYDSSGAGGDIAVVHLPKPVAVAPIGLGTLANPGVGVRVLGWGQTCPDPGCGDAPALLQQLDSQLVDPAQCTAAFDAKTELCTGNPDGKSGVCYGDSGGPEVVQADGNWLLVGVTSRPGDQSVTCAKAPSIFTSAVAYAAWITQQTVDTPPPEAPAPPPTP